jgi:hypothetical protein
MTRVPSVVIDGKEMNRQERAFEYIRTHPGVHKKTLLVYLECRTNSAENLLASLEEMGLLLYEGEGGALYVFEERVE